MNELTVIDIVDSFTLEEQQIVTAKDYAAFVRLAQKIGA